MPRKPPSPPPGELVIKIVTSEEAYYITEHSDLRRVDDEISLNIVGRIERISLPGRQKDVGREIDVSLRCARSYSRGEPTAPTNKPFMAALTLDKQQCLCMAYLPAEDRSRRAYPCRDQRRASALWVG